MGHLVQDSGMYSVMLKDSAEHQGQRGGSRVWCTQEDLLWGHLVRYLMEGASKLRTSEVGTGR